MDEELKSNTDPGHIPKTHLFIKQIIIEYVFCARHGKQIYLRGGGELDKILHRYIFNYRQLCSMLKNSEQLTNYNKVPLLC